jgi:hypothetical protein
LRPSLKFLGERKPKGKEAETLSRNFTYNNKLYAFQEIRKEEIEQKD